MGNIDQKEKEGRIFNQCKKHRLLLGSNQSCGICERNREIELKQQLSNNKLKNSHTYLLWQNYARTFFGLLSFCLFLAAIYYSAEKNKKRKKIVISQTFQSGFEIKTDYSQNRENSQKYSSPRIHSKSYSLFSFNNKETKIDKKNKTDKETKIDKKNKTDKNINRDPDGSNDKLALLKIKIAIKKAITQVPITLYFTEWCPICLKARLWLEKYDIPYKGYDIEADVKNRERYVQINPQGSVPTFVIDKQVIIGFSPKDLQQKIFESASKFIKL